jgi:hypothetical protein
VSKLPPGNGANCGAHGIYNLNTFKVCHAAIASALLTLSVLFVPLASAAGSLPPPLLKTDTPMATAGFYRLTWIWHGDGQPIFELQEAATPEFDHPRVLYDGADEASSLSGREDGSYYYRVRARSDGDPAGPWSDTVEVTVQHHPLWRAIAFFAGGAVVFLATFALIIGGTLRARKEG